jgi:hypothetical protein
MGRCNVAHSIRPPTAHRFLVRPQNSLPFLANVANNVQVWTDAPNSFFSTSIYEIWNEIDDTLLTSNTNILPALLLTLKLLLSLFSVPPSIPSVRPKQTNKKHLAILCCCHLTCQPFTNGVILGLKNKNHHINNNTKKRSGLLRGWSRLSPRPGSMYQPTDHLRLSVPSRLFWWR